MIDNPLDAVMSRIEAATHKSEMFNGLNEAKNVLNDEDFKPAFIEAIAIKSLNPHFDTSPLLVDTAKEISRMAESTGREIHPSELDKAIGKAVRKVKEEQLLGASSRSADRSR